MTKVPRCWPSATRSDASTKRWRHPPPCSLSWRLRPSAPRRPKSPAGRRSARWCAGPAASPATRSDPCLSARSEEHTSELQSRQYLVCRLLLEKKKKKIITLYIIKKKKKKTKKKKIKNLK